MLSYFLIRSSSPSPQSPPRKRRGEDTRFSPLHSEAPWGRVGGGAKGQRNRVILLKSIALPKIGQPKGWPYGTRAITHLERHNPLGRCEEKGDCRWSLSEKTTG